MLTTVFLGIQFLVQSVTGGGDVAVLSDDDAKKKTVLAMALGCGIGWAYAFRAAAAVF